MFSASFLAGIKTEIMGFPCSGILLSLGLKKRLVAATNNCTAVKTKINAARYNITIQLSGSCLQCNDCKTSCRLPESILHQIYYVYIQKHTCKYPVSGTKNSRSGLP